MKSLASDATLSKTRERLLTVEADDRALWGKMSATQMMMHLDCALEMAMGERMMEPVKGMPPAVMKWVALRSGLRWPKNISTTPELRLLIESAENGEFRERAGRTLERMEAFVSEARCAPTHPFFGQMTRADWMRWGYLHTDHHLRQFGR